MLKNGFYVDMPSTVVIIVWYEGGFALSKYCVVEGKGMQCGFLAFRDLNGHLCPMLITLESPGPLEPWGAGGADAPP